MTKIRNLLKIFKQSNNSFKTCKIGISKGDAKPSQKNKRSSSQTSISDHKANVSRSNSRLSVEPENDDDSLIKTHKYIIEASVLKESWPLSPSNWEFVNKLKEAEVSELKVFSKDANDTNKDAKQSVDPKAAATNAAAAKNSKAPTAKGKAGKGTAVAPSRPASSVFDLTKPHWTLKWVTEDTNAVNLFYYSIIFL